MRIFLKIFEEAKQSTAKHERLFKELVILQNKSEKEWFFNTFFACFKIALHADLKANNAEVKRVMLFVSKFCLKNKKQNDEVEEMDEFLRNIILEALRYHDIECIAERLRCCEFFSVLLKEMGDAAIDEEIWQFILNAMLERLKVR